MKRKTTFTKRIIPFGIIAVVLIAAIFNGSTAVLAEGEPDLTVTLLQCCDAEFRVSAVTWDDTGDPMSRELAKVLEFTITVDGEQVYTGSADEIPTPVFDWTELGLGEVMEIDVDFVFHKDAGNQFQGVPFKMTWYFEARDMDQVIVQLSDDVFYHNGNINPGDHLNYKIKVINSGVEVFNITTQPPENTTRPDGGDTTNPDGTTNPGGGTTNPGGDTTNPGGKTNPGGGAVDPDSTKPGGKPDEKVQTGVDDMMQKYVSVGIILVAGALMSAMLLMVLWPKLRKEEQQESK